MGTRSTVPPVTVRERAHARSIERSAAASGTPDLTALVTHYQDALRLRDWRIVATYERDLRSSDGHEVWGLCYPNVDAKVARIVVRDPSTPPSGATAEEALATVVETVVHELLHLHFAPFANAEPTAIAAEEQAVWAIAEALVKARGTADEAVFARAVTARIKDFGARAALITTTKEKTMALDPKMAEEAVALLVKKDQKGALAFVERFVVAAVGGTPAAGEEPPGEGEEPPPPEMTGEEPPPGEGEEPPPPAARARSVVTVEAFARSVLALVGMTNHAEALDEIERRSKALADLEKREGDLVRDRATLEGSERRKLITNLIDLRAETPATAWVEVEGKPSTTPVPRLAGEPIASLRARVKALTPKAPPPKLRVPGGPGATGSSVKGLTEREVAMCKAKKIDPEAYRAKRDSLLPQNDEET